jgi:hypothetical protein
MKHFFVLICMVFAAAASESRAQVVPSATAQRISLTAGGMASAFQPDYSGGGVALTSPSRLYGIGAYVDVKFSRWVQIEGEGRWLRFNQYDNIYQDNYLIGPRIPIHRFKRATPYGKVLVGLAEMNFEYSSAHGNFTDIAYGGGVDIKLNKRFTVRAFDFEYQMWPKWLSSSLYPYGASVGVGYKIF